MIVVVEGRILSAERGEKGLDLARAALSSNPALFLANFRVEEASFSKTDIPAPSRRQKRKAQAPD